MYRRRRPSRWPCQSLDYKLIFLFSVGMICESVFLNHKYFHPQSTCVYPFAITEEFSLRQVRVSITYLVGDNVDGPCEPILAHQEASGTGKIKSVVPKRPFVEAL